jgi:hypothetical protein
LAGQLLVKLDKHSSISKIETKIMQYTETRAVVCCQHSQVGNANIMLHCKFYYYYNIEFECVFLLCLEWDFINILLSFSLENSFPIVLSGEVYSALDKPDKHSPISKNRRKNCCNRIDDCNVAMVTSISPQHYQKETKQYYSIIEFECVFLLCLEWDFINILLSFSLENSFPIVLSGEVYSALAVGSGTIPHQTTL